MKKIFTLMAAALMSVAMWAGANDLLWDYSEAAPASSPDNGLYFNNKFSDGPGTKNGLRGIKLNDGGYCYFTKAAVAGKLKLSYGPRSGSNAANIDVYTWAGESTTAPAKADMTLVGTTKELTEYGSDEIELTAEQNHVYLCRHNGIETGLQVIQFKEKVARTFVDFELIMCNMASEYDFTTLPEGVMFAVDAEKDNIRKDLAIQKALDLIAE